MSLDNRPGNPAYAGGPQRMHYPGAAVGSSRVPAPHSDRQSLSALAS
jgi:hypothetical protein